MTNNQLTKEWLQQTIAELESVRDEIPFGIDTNSELELAAFKMALAAMDSEPVAYAWVSRSGKKHLTRCEPEQWRDAVILTPLYRHAQPAPELAAIVERLNLSGYEYEGGEVTPQNAAAIVDTLLQQLDDEVQGRNAQPVPVVPEEMNFSAACNFVQVNGMAKEDRVTLAMMAWNACRAAMLAAAQPAPTIQVTDAMAYAFHHALTDGPLGDDDVEDIKTGLRSAFANVSTNQSVLVVPDRFIFEKWWETQNGSPLDGWDSLRTTDGYCDEVIDGQFEAWRACRAAMCATDKSSNHADCQSKLIKNCASGASAKQHG
ncbi:TPA: hypothetical protein SLP51_002411 [Klebsiella aerogenes]|nr:hypothetical protein [Klebsiella aerogenes]